MTTISTTFKKKVQTWVTKHHVIIFFVFQLLLGVGVSLLHPNVETFFVLMFWWSLYALCYLCYRARFPLLLLISLTLLFARIVTIPYNTLDSLTVLITLGTLTVLFLLYVVSKKIPKIVSAVNNFKSSEKILATHLEEISTMGALVLQLELCTIIGVYFLFVNRLYALNLINTGWLFFLPFTVIFSASFLFATTMQMVVCVFFNTTYGFHLLNQLYRSTYKVVIMGGAGVTGYINYTEYATGGRADPLLWLPFIKYIQHSTLGAHSSTALGVRLLKKFKDVGGTVPPLMPGTSMVDVVLIQNQIESLEDRQKMFREMNRRHLEAISSKFVFNPKATEEENYSRWMESFSPPNITDETAHDRVQVGVRPSESDFPSKKKDEK